ncbi:MAG TPA: sugar phosphate isomerase/epimerase [Acholeplasmataceae bacterium]|jgi:sugar phosphate isomerase/epimerase|nr:sugar phosphate isomerase/epimerase [Acholeplasmataceae bacterium]
MRKCFTINPTRTAADIESYRPLLEKGIYQGIEIFYPYHLDPRQQEDYTAGIGKIKADFPAVEVVMHLPYGPAHDLGDFVKAGAVVELLKNAIDYAVRFDVTKLTLHLGYANPEIERAVSLRHIESVLKDLTAYAATRRMEVMIENMPGPKELGYSPEEIKTLIARVGAGNLKFILDTGHAYLSDFSIEEYIDALASNLRHIHFSDNDGSGDQHARLGSGTIDFHSVLKKLKEISYEGLCCMEIIFASADDLYRNAADFDKYDIY